MKKVIKTSLSLLSVVALITACSNEKSMNLVNPIVGTVAENEIPSEPDMLHSDKSEYYDDMKSECKYKKFMGADGNTLSVNEAVNVLNLNSESSTNNYAMEYDFAYFTYTPSMYEGDLVFDIPVDSAEYEEKYNEYLLSKAYVFKVKKGDKLQNGLICTDAVTYYFDSPKDNESIFISTDACFSGELTLTGTIRYLKEDPIVGKGALQFFPDSSCGKIPCVYEENFFPARQYSNPWLGLGNISDLPDNLASLIKDNEYTNVEVTIKDLHLSYANNKTNYGSSAVIVDMKTI